MNIAKQALIILNMIPQLSSIRIKRLIDYFGNIQDILKASESELQKIEGIGRTVARNIVTKRADIDINEELNLINKHNIEVVAFDETEYPENLKTIYDPPPILYIKGKLKQKDNLSVAIVGSRRASFYGLSMAEGIASELAEFGITVISGMARGIDGAAHKGALKVEGRTIAVLGSGLDCVYPPENKKLFGQIVESGAVISEFPMGTKPLAGNFPRRNRIISGLSQGVVVVEASRNSGALITADFALEQSREVFAIPGKADSLTSFGTNRLIKQGAKLVDNVEDIIEELQLKIKDHIKQSKIKKSKESVIPPKLNLTLEEDKIYNNINAKPKYVDEIIEDSGLSTERVLVNLMQMEIKHLVKQLPGKFFIRLRSPKPLTKASFGG